MLLRSGKIHEGIALMHKAENDALRDDIAAGRRQFCTSKQSVSQCVKPPPPPAWIMQPPRLADTAEQDYFTLRRELITMQKQLEGTEILFVWAWCR